jgi:hypothetical protein
LGERRNNTTKGLGYGFSSSRGQFDRDESAFMEVYSETSGSREVVESLLEVRDVVGNSTDNDESVVGIQTSVQSGPSS